MHMHSCGWTYAVPWGCMTAGVWVGSHPKRCFSLSSGSHQGQKLFFGTTGKHSSPSKCRYLIYFCTFFLFVLLFSCVGKTCTSVKGEFRTFPQKVQNTQTQQNRCVLRSIHRGTKRRQKKGPRIFLPSRRRNKQIAPCFRRAAVGQQASALKNLPYCTS